MIWLDDLRRLQYGETRAPPKVYLSSSKRGNWEIGLAVSNASYREIA